MNNIALKKGQFMEFSKCPVCGNNTIYAANSSAICDTCDCQFVWFQEEGNKKKTLIADPFAEYVEQLGRKQDQQRQIYAGKWIAFYNRCEKFYPSVKAYAMAKKIYGDVCMLYKRG